MRTREIYSNCVFGIFYLLIRGRVARLIVTPGTHWSLPVHLGAITERGHYLHFYRELPHECNTFAPFWFLGAFRGHSRARWRRVIGQRGRITELPLWLAWLICIVGYVVLFIPWNIAWMFFGPYWTFKWAAKGLVRRWRVSGTCQARPGV